MLCYFHSSLHTHAKYTHIHKHGTPYTRIQCTTGNASLQLIIPPNYGNSNEISLSRFAASAGRSTSYVFFLSNPPPPTLSSHFPTPPHYPSLLLSLASPYHTHTPIRLLYSTQKIPLIFPWCSPKILPLRHSMSPHLNTLRNSNFNYNNNCSN